MEPKKIPLKDIAIDPLAEELMRSEEARPYTDFFAKAYNNDAAGVQSALQVLRDLPLEKRYTWRVFSALKWAFADFDDECVKLDLLHIPQPKRTRLRITSKKSTRQWDDIRTLSLCASPETCSWPL